RRTSSLPAGSPGTIARVPLWSFTASSRRSSRSLALRELSSGPWQLKHLLEISGRICELKSTGSFRVCFFALAAKVAPPEPPANTAKPVSRANPGNERFMQFFNDECWRPNSLPPFDRMKQPACAWQERSDPKAIDERLGSKTRQRHRCKPCE